MIRYDMIYLLTAIGLPSVGSSTVHIYTQTINRTTQNKQYIKQHKNCQKKKLTGFSSKQIIIPHTMGKPNFCFLFTCLVQGIDLRNIHTRHLHNW